MLRRTLNKPNAPSPLMGEGVIQRPLRVTGILAQRVARRNLPKVLILPLRIFRESDPSAPLHAIITRRWRSPILP